MKRILTFILLVFSITGVYAKHLTEQEAMERALQYMNSGKAVNGRMLAPARKGSIKLSSVPVEADRIYAFNMENGGFIVASADSRTLPVLGYSTTGSIDWDNMSDNMREWLKSYDEAIATLGDRTDFVDGNSTDETGTRQDRTPVEPLIKTHWDQDAPYWDKVPLYNGADPNYKGKKCYTGCVATALAQVMYFYQWPKTVPNGIPDYDISTSYLGSNKVWHMDALPPVVFEWENMLETYIKFNPETQKYDQLGDNIQRNAVATLMRYCGQATTMEYSPDGSTASVYSYETALKDYFNYESVQFLTSRSSYDIDEWEKILYDEVAAGRPVLYGGFTESSGHAFICDGYDESGLFHINWGWSGVGDGYFSLSVLNPYDNISAGSGSSGIGFCAYQCAAIHIHPTEKISPYNKSGEESYQYETMDLLDRNTVAFKFIYTNDDAGEVTQDYALGTIAENGTLNPDFIGDPSDSILYSGNYMIVVIDSTRFQPGDSLKLHPMHRLRKPGAEWKIIPPLEWYVVAGCTDNGSFFINIYGENFKLKCIDGTISKGTGRLGERNDVKVSIKNLLDKDYQDEMYLIPYYYGHVNKDQANNASPLSQGEPMFSYGFIRGGQTNDVTFSFVPQQGGLVQFLLVFQDKPIGSFSLELDNDTLVDYSNYIENNSWLSCEYDKWYYNIELYDKPDAINMPYWIPSDSIGLKVRLFWDDEQVDDIFIRDEIREYLSLLPEKGGDGSYTFSYRIPIEIRPDCVIYMDSYLGEWINNNLTQFCCHHASLFQYTDPTIVEPVDALQDNEPYYDILGRPIDGIPQKKGLYIKGNRKVYIK